MAAEGFSALPREARAYQMQRAGLVSRGVAAVVDAGVVVGFLLIGYGAWAVLSYLLNPRNFSFPDIGLFFSLALGFFVAVIYLGLAWRISGRSYGCLVMGLRVVNYRGGRLRLAGALLRALFCVLVPIGILWVAVSRENRSLQDSVLRTSVIYDWQPRAASSAATRTR